MTIHRRDFIGGTLIAAGGSSLTGMAFGSRSLAADSVGPRRALRFVHFGDTHVGGGATMPFCATDQGYPKALAHVREMDDAPEFILHTGDIVTDAFWATEE